MILSVSTLYVTHVKRAEASKSSRRLYLCDFHVVTFMLLKHLMASATCANLYDIREIKESPDADAINVDHRHRGSSQGEGKEVKSHTEV